MSRRKHRPLPYTLGPFASGDEDFSEALESILSYAYRPLYDRSTGETFLICHVCDEADGHLDGCPIELLKIARDQTIESEKRK